MSVPKFKIFVIFPNFLRYLVLRRLATLIISLLY